MGLPVEINPLLISSSGYVVGRSLRFRSSASAYLNRTFSASNRKTWTWSGWIKRGQLARTMLFCTPDGNNPSMNFEIQNDTFWIQDYDGTTNQIYLTSTAVLRDPAAWYHLVFALDTTQATASNRAKMYINGVQVTSFVNSNYPTQNYDGAINRAVDTRLGAQANRASSYFDGYMAEVNFIDGQALTPSSFGAYDTNGVWQPLKYGGTYGTNGFYLPFSDTTSTTTLCYDKSGNGNNWTPNNISLTAGTTYDSMIDSPTVSASSSNYAVLNPLDRVTGGAPVDGNLSQTASSSANAYSSIPVDSGKFYAEFTLVTAPSSGWAYIGVSSNNGNNLYVYRNSDGNFYNNSSYVAYGASYTNGDVIGVAINVASGTLEFYKNGTSQGQLTGLSFPGQTYYIIAPRTSAGTGTIAANFGQRPFSYTPPSGYNALNTYNLPAPSIANGAQYMAATLYTGTGSALTVSNAVNGVSFQPDLVWVKSRSTVENNFLFDSVRGSSPNYNRLESNLTDAEATPGVAMLTAINNNGFTLGTNAGVNASATTYVSWNWKAGGTGVTNTAGTITSTVSANTTAGFSVVTWTAGGAGTTIGHGLGVAPNMIIVKDRSVSADWCVYTTTTGAGAFLKLNSTAASAADTTMWGNTTPTSTTFKWGYSTGDSMVAYCFAAVRGYSAFGSYTGNGSTDGPFVFTNMRPRFVMVKRTDSSDAGNAHWFMYDSSRNTYNSTTNWLAANLSNAEASTSNIDLLSNGFKWRDSGNAVNASGGTYIYAAFAENPFNYSRAR